MAKPVLVSDWVNCKQVSIPDVKSRRPFGLGSNQKYIKDHIGVGLVISRTVFL